MFYNAAKNGGSQCNLAWTSATVDLFGSMDWWISYLNDTFPVCVLQSEPFNGQGSLPSGGAGGYNAFTQAAVSGVGHTEMYHWMMSLPETLWSSKHSSPSYFLSQVGAEWCQDILVHRWEGTQRLQWHLGHPYLPTCPQARTQNLHTSHQRLNPTSATSSTRQVRL